MSIFKTEPFLHQMKAFEETKDYESYAFLWEAGTGKTKVVLDTAAYLFMEKKINGLIVIAPNGVHQNWLYDEIPKHLSIPYKAFAWESSKSRTKAHKFKINELFKTSALAVILAPYSALNTDSGKHTIKHFLSNKRALYVLDEAHYIKNTKAARTKTAIKSSPLAKYRRILTGTPVTKSPLDLWAQLEFTDSAFLRSHRISSYWIYRGKFCVFEKKGRMSPSGFRQYDALVGYKNIEYLQCLLRDISSRVLKSDALDLPDKLYQKRYFDLIPDQKIMYNKLKDDFLAEYEESIIDATHALTRLLRLQQITSGFIVDEHQNTHRFIKNPRLDLLTDLLDGYSDQAIIWARFTSDVDAILDRLGDKAVRYDGKISSGDRLRNKELYVNGDKQFFVAKQQSASTGLTLINTKAMIYYSNTFSLTERLQSEDRAHRAGLKHPVTYIDLIADGTVDSNIINNLRNKLDIASRITGDELRSWL